MRPLARLRGGFCPIVLLSLLAASAVAQTSCNWTNPEGVVVETDCVIPGGLQGPNVIVGNLSGPAPVLSGPAQYLLPPKGVHARVEHVTIIPESPGSDNAQQWMKDTDRGQATVLFRDVRVMQPVSYIPVGRAAYAMARDNRTVLYSDNATWIYVNWLSAPSPLQFQNVFLLGQGAGSLHPPVDALAAGAASRAAAAAATANRSAPAAGGDVLHWLAADNSTLVPLLLQHASFETDQPLLVMLTSNVSLCYPPYGPVPTNGIHLMRPVLFVGSSVIRTGVNFCNQVNQIRMLGKHSASQWDSLVLENLGYGDELSAGMAFGNSLVFSMNFWPAYFPRVDGWRLHFANCTHVLASSADLYYLAYWTTAFNSPFPYFKNQTQWMRLRLAVEALDVISTNQTYIIYTRFSWRNGGGCTNGVVTTVPEIFPKMPLPPPEQWQPSLTTNNPSPLVESCSDGRRFQDCLSGGLISEERQYVMLLLQPLSLRDVKEPQGGYVVPRPIMIAGSTQGTLETYWDDLPLLDLAHQRNILMLPENADQQHLTLSGLKLVGLAQGPSAANATELVPDVWTILLWNVYRPAMAATDTLIVRASILCIPPQELQTLRQLAAQGPNFQLNHLTNQFVAARADQLEGVWLRGVRSIDSDTVMIDSLHGFGLNATNVRLESLQQCARGPSGAAAVVAATVVAANAATRGEQGSSGVWEPADGSSGVPGFLLDQFYWPANAQLPVVVSGGGGPSLTPGMIAGLVVAVVVGSLLALAAMGYVLGWNGRMLAVLTQHSKGPKPLAMAEGASPDAGASSGSRSNGRSSGRAAAVTAPAQYPRGSSDVETGMLAAAVVPGGSPAAIVKGPGSAAASSGAPAAPLTPGQAYSAASDDHVVMGTMPWASLVAQPLAAALAAVTRKVQQRQLAYGTDGAVQQPRSSSDVPPAPAPASAGHLVRPARKSGVSAVSGPSGAKTADSGNLRQHLQLHSAIGSGSFGQVFKGTWRGSPVAVKVIRLPAMGEMRSRLESMAVREVAISSSMSHPNVVQVFCYSLAPCMTDTRGVGSFDVQMRGRAGAAVAEAPASPAGGSGGVVAADATVTAWELRLVMELCEQGSVRAALDTSQLSDPGTGRPHWPTVVSLAQDVARAMAHLHSMDVLHLDLKAGNVLLKHLGFAPLLGSQRRSSDQEASLRTKGRLVAKVTDFGLAMPLDPFATHISSMHAGTLTHMAPELLTSGHASKASDIYAFGIFMWELATGGRAFAGTPRALLGHQVAAEGRRPMWPRDMTAHPASPFSPSPPAGLLAYQELAVRCWTAEPRDRPTFDEVCNALGGLVTDLSAAAQTRSHAE